jgi:hypothetical protein
MATAFPRAVIWSKDRPHHQTVLVDWVVRRVTVNCYECEKGYELFLADLNWLKKVLADAKDVQVVAWVERYE